MLKCSPKYIEMLLCWEFQKSTRHFGLIKLFSEGILLEKPNIVGKFQKPQNSVSIRK